MDESTAARFWAKVNKNGTTPEHRPELGRCWLWKAPSGRYGVFWYQGTSRLAHRFSYEAECGSVAEGLEIDHLCKVTKCVRPSHLEAVSRPVNNERSNSPSSINAKRTECKHGHSLSGENLYITAKGTRQCATCKKAIEDKWSIDRRAAKAAGFSTVRAYLASQRSV